MYGFQFQLCIIPVKLISFPLQIGYETGTEAELNVVNKSQAGKNSSVITGNLVTYNAKTQPNIKR